MEQLVRMVAAHLGDREEEVRAATAPPVMKVVQPKKGAKLGRVCLQYTFRLGLQRLTLQDDFAVRDGQIRRLRRSRA
jgi:hypothetical protein